jgi:ribosomal protein S18 acetylase RimI-like enzyme
MIHIEQIRPELTWQLRRDILYPEGIKQNMGLPQDDHGVHFGAFKDNKLVGVVSLFQTGTDFQFRKLAIDPSTQKMGVGSSLLQYIIDYAKENNGERMWCNARDTAFGFYLKAGFTFTGEVFTKGSINYEIMEKVITHFPDPSVN